MEEVRLSSRCALLELEKKRIVRMKNQDMRTVLMTLDFINSSSGHSPEGLAPGQDPEYRPPETVDECFMYGDRQVSRRFGKFRRAQSAPGGGRMRRLSSKSDTVSSSGRSTPSVTFTDRRSPEESLSVSRLNIGQKKTVCTARPHTSPEIKGNNKHIDDLRPHTSPSVSSSIDKPVDDVRPHTSPNTAWDRDTKNNKRTNSVVHTSRTCDHDTENITKTVRNDDDIKQDHHITSRPSSSIGHKAELETANDKTPVSKRKPAFSRIKVDSLDAPPKHKCKTNREVADDDICKPAKLKRKGSRRRKKSHVRTSVLARSVNDARAALKVNKKQTTMQPWVTPISRSSRLPGNMQTKKRIDHERQKNLNMKLELFREKHPLPRYILDDDDDSTDSEPWL